MKKESPQWSKPVAHRPSAGPVDLSVAHRLLTGAHSELARLRVMRGTHRRAAQRMRRALAALTLATSLLGAPLALPASALPTVFKAPPNLPVVEEDAAPHLVDIDGDGDLDFFFGSKYGNLNFAENTGSRTTPVLAPIVVNPFGFARIPDQYGTAAAGYVSAPFFVDIEGDGDFDAFVGGYSDVFFFENTGTKNTPAFGPVQTDPFGISSAPAEGYLTHIWPSLVDIDGDRDQDLFLGALNGKTQFLENTGTRSSPAFAAPVENPFNITDPPYQSGPQFADLDGDGDFDMLIPDVNGPVHFFENTGSATSPNFAAGNEHPFGLILGSAMRADGVTVYAPLLALGDTDGDGDTDVVIGDYTGATHYVENVGTPNAPAFAPFGGMAAQRQLVSPEAVDIDGDGDMDLMVGRVGGVAFFERTGKPAAFAFETRVDNPFGLAPGSGLHGSFADIDDDGDPDAIFPGVSLQGTQFLENTGSATAPAFAPGVANAFGLGLGEVVRALEIADLDGDGDFDAFATDTLGYLRFFENTGLLTVPEFADGVVGGFNLPARFVHPRYKVTPTLADIDGDDDLDLMIGTRTETTGATDPQCVYDCYVGETLYFENTGSSASPEFAPGVEQSFGIWPMRGDEDYSNYGQSSPQAVDLDGDGDFDIMVGEALGRLHVFRNISSEVTCGNGRLEAGEICDDGNTSDGDCCSSTCTHDPAGTACGNDGNACTVGSTCDGAGLCGECSAPIGGVGDVCGSLCGGPIQCKQPAPGVCRCGGPTIR